MSGEKVFFRSRHLLLLLAVLLGSQAPAQKRYSDTKYGYELKPLPKWDAMPVQPNEQYLVSKWVLPGGKRGLPAEVHVFVFNRNPKPPRPQGVGGGEIPAGVIEYPPLRPAKRSYSAWLLEDYVRKGMKLGKGRRLKVKGAGKRKVISARLYTTKRPSGWTRGAATMSDFSVLCAVITTKELEYAIECFCSEQAARKLQGSFKSFIKSFRLLPSAKVLGGAAGTEKREGYDQAKVSPKERARKRAMENARRAPGWWLYETPRYIIVTNVKKKRRPFILDIGRRLEAMRDQYEKDFPPTAPITAVSICRVCKNGESYTAYGGPGGSAGYWNPAGEELVFYRENSTDTPLRVLNHEAFHQYIHYACGEIDPHTWYNEGFGDYYAGASIQGRRVSKIEPFKWRRDTIRQAVRDGSYVPLRKMIRYSQGQYYANADLCYAQGWSMVYFLKKGLKRGHRWAKILPTYLKELQKTRDREQARVAAFKGVDLDKLEAAWKLFTTKGKKASN